MKINPAYIVIAVLSVIALILGGAFIYFATSQSYMRQQLESIEREKESQRMQQEKVTNAVTDLFSGGEYDYSRIVAQRQHDVNEIANAIYEYAMDSGTAPRTIPLGEVGEICRTGAYSCEGFVDFSLLVGKYLPRLPIDPTDTSDNGTGYGVVIQSNGRVTVSALHAPMSEPIEITR